MDSSVSTAAAWRPNEGAIRSAPSQQAVEPFIPPTIPVRALGRLTTPAVITPVNPTIMPAYKLRPVDTVAALVSRAITKPDSVVLEIWEGVVQAVNEGTQAMDVVLEAKSGAMPTHVAQIELQWVADQDKDLVRPGAVFYLTLYKRTKHGSVANGQELRFRRRPGWSNEQLAQVKADAAALEGKIVQRPMSE